MNGNIIDDFFKKYKNIMETMVNVNIMTVGKTGVGKSTLINNVFREKLAKTGVGSPVTQHLRKYSKDNIPISIYDTKGLELKEDVQNKIKEEIIEEVERRARSGNEAEYIHVLWYCINASSNRIEEFEIEWIDELSKVLPVIVVLTQSFSKASDDFYRYIDDKNLPIKSIQKVLAEQYEINEDIQIPPNGLEDLVKTTYGILPEAVRKAFINAQKVDIDSKVDAAIKWTAGYVTGSFATGFTPIPFSDALVLVPIQVSMLAHITAIFGVSISKSLISGIVGSIGGAGGAAMLGRYIVSNLLKLIPGIGTVAGGAISATTAAIITTALATAYIKVMKVVAKHEYEGKRLSNEEIAEMVKKQFEKELKKDRSKKDIKDMITV